MEHIYDIFFNINEWKRVTSTVFCSTKQWKPYRFKIGTTWVWVNNDKFIIGVNYPFSTFTKRHKKNNRLKKKKGMTKSGKKMPKKSHVKVNKERRKDGKRKGERHFLLHYKGWFTATFNKSEWLGLNYTDTERSPSWMRGRNRRRGRAGGGEQRSNTPVCELWVIHSDTCSAIMTLFFTFLFKLCFLLLKVCGGLFCS